VRPNLESLEDRLSPTGISLGASSIAPPIAATAQVQAPPATAAPAVAAAAVTGLPTTTAITSVATTYTLFTQVEKVTATVTLPSGTLVVNEGNVSITDNGQTQTVAIVNGAATATFTFALYAFQENPNAHTVTASYSDPSGTNLFGSSSTSVTAPATTTAYFFQLYYNILLFELFTSSMSSSSSSSSSSSGG
jgi:hypothetical protein